MQMAKNPTHISACGVGVRNSGVHPLYILPNYFCIVSHQVSPMGIMYLTLMPEVITLLDCTIQELHSNHVASKAFEWTFLRSRLFQNIMMSINYSPVILTSLLIPLMLLSPVVTGETHLMLVKQFSVLFIPVSVLFKLTTNLTIMCHNVYYLKG